MPRGVRVYAHFTPGGDGSAGGGFPRAPDFARCNFSTFGGPENPGYDGVVRAEQFGGRWPSCRYPAQADCLACLRDRLPHEVPKSSCDFCLYKTTWN